MTISSTTNKEVHTGNGSVAEFSYTYRMDNDNDMQVYINDTLQPSGYTVTRNSNNIGGTVTFDSAPVNGDIITLLRVLEMTQETDYVPYDAFPAESHEQALDKLTILVQQNKEEINRAVKAPVGGDEDVSYALPRYEAGKAIKWSPTEKKLENSDFPLQQYVDDAATSASNAATSESNAATSESNAATSASDAATSESNAATSASNAATSASNAGNSASDANTSKNHAYEWASKDIDQIVDDGVRQGYSSFHWAEKARQTAIDSLLSINKQINANAVVDVCIYDTSLDDDSGDWVDRATWQSWYHEPLNTSTRGKTRKFPKLALVVAEKDKVTIYDGNDPDLPMWMVFNGDGGWSTGVIHLAASTPDAKIQMLNGKLYVGDTVASLGLDAIDFIKDTAWTYTKTNTWGGDSQTDIAGRNSTTHYQQGAGGDLPVIVSNSINGIAVVTDSGMNNIVGIATDNGVSIIHPDNTIADISGTSGYNNILSIDFPDNTNVWLAGVGFGNVDNVGGTMTIPSTDVTGSTNWYDNLDHAYGDLGSNPAPTFIGDPKVVKASDNLQAMIAGKLQLIQHDFNDPSKGMICTIGGNFTSGYMPGDIKGAFLANSMTIDRSYNGFDLDKTGTITESPVATGAELMAYSGFSTSNYLEQAYNADLDFGTGDFYIMGWVSVPDDTNYHGICDRDSDDQNTNTGIVLLTTNGKYLRCKISGSILTDNSTALIPSVFSFVAMKRSSGTVTLYVNGKSVASATLNGNVTDTSATLAVGGYWQNGSLVGGNKIALLRIGAGAPSDDLIKKIYEAERPLFRENSKCLISTHSLKSLDFDKETDILSIGSTHDVYKLNGLVVVDSIQDPASSISFVKGKLLTGYTTGSKYKQGSVNLRELANKLGL